MDIPEVVKPGDELYVFEKATNHLLTVGMPVKIDRIGHGEVIAYDSHGHTRQFNRGIFGFTK